MTWTWDMVDGDLAVWTYDQDPESDAPAATQTPDDDARISWGHDNLGNQHYPEGLFDLMWAATADYYNTNLGDETVDFKLARLIAEAAFEQIEKR